MIKVITYGTFDLFHKGHYRLLQRAKALGDCLIVGITTENYDKARGKLNVIDSLMTRIENVKKTGFADEIIIEESIGQKISDIRKYKIDIITFGSDWVGRMDYLKEYCQVVYLERTKGVSSTMLRVKNQPILRIGVIGTGRIAKRFLPEAVSVSGVNVQGVYNPHLESASRFADQYKLEFYPSLDEFFESIDAVYIASPHGTHFEYIKKSLENGKHVLCEKPMVLKKSQAEELFAYAKEKQLVLFEGIKTAYCPGFNKLMEIAGSGLIGNIRAVDATFTKLENPKGRELTDLECGGSFTELASYCLLPIIKLFGLSSKEIRFDSICGDNGLDLYTKASLIYGNGIGTATCGLGAKSEGDLRIAGTEGYLYVPAPWWKTSYFEVRREDPNDVERYSEKFMGDGLRYEIGDFLSMVNGSQQSEFKLTREESIALADMMEMFKSQNNR